MKNIAFVIAIFISSPLVAQKNQKFSYNIDVTQNMDTFYISLNVPSKLKRSSGVYQFAATAPGTYQTMNIGRFVSDFKALDKKGRSLQARHLSVNQFAIEKPKKIKTITYKVAETFDTPMEEYPIYLMAGSSIEDDHALINIHTMIGYFEGYQKAPLEISVLGKPDWVIGTALEKHGEHLHADDFDHAVDSPILLGELSYADTTIANTDVKVYTYATEGKLNSSILLESMSELLDASREFLVKLPVDNYTFLYFFEPNIVGQTGAWEHSYSSEYVLGENDPTEEFLTGVIDIASHEFFHIVTPLNIHSEVVESFNFVEPTTSQHLWLYEGVTEWASHILQYRGDKISLEDYLANAVAFKMLVEQQYFDKTWSLKKIADESFSGGEGAEQYGNVYYRGSLVAGLLDIRLLELSEGKSGLRELMLQLVEKYGKGTPVSEETFFDDIAAMTFPEIRTFFDQYVLEANPLPHTEYLAKIGLEVTTNESGRPIVIKTENMSSKQTKMFEAWSQNLSLF